MRASAIFGLSTAISWSHRTSSGKHFSRSPTRRNYCPRQWRPSAGYASINSDVEVQGIVGDLTPENAGELLADSELLLDGTDNFETRLLINDYAVKNSHALDLCSRCRQPWAYDADPSGRERLSGVSR